MSKKYRLDKEGRSICKECSILLIDQVNCQLKGSPYCSNCLDKWWDKTIKASKKEGKAMKKEFEMLGFRGLTFRQPKESFGVEVLANGKWYGIEALYLRNISRDYANVPDVGLWIDRSYHGSVQFTAP